MQKILLLIGLAVGLGIAYVDSRPTWDDTAITIFGILLAAGILGLFLRRRPWLLALAVGLWLPLVEVLSSHRFESLIALAVAFVGAYAGWGIGQAVRRAAGPV